MNESWYDAALHEPESLRLSFVTGGRAGIGHAIAASLASAGARVAITGRDIVKAMLQMDDRGFTPELSVFATNPKD